MSTVADANSLPTCVESRRLESAEKSIDMVKNNITEIKDTLYSIDKEIRIDLNKLSGQFSEFSTIMQGVAVRGEERDKRNTEIFMENKRSFERFGTRMDVIETKITEHSKEDIKHDNKLINLERMVYGMWGIIGVVGGFILQQYLGK